MKKIISIFIILILISNLLAVSQKPKQELNTSNDILKYVIDNLEFKNANIREALKMLGLRSNINIIPDQNVRGQVSIFLNNVTLREALDEIIENKVYLWERTGERVIRVRNAEYVMTQVFPLGYTSSKDIETLIKEFGINASVFSDSKTNSLIARGSVKNLRKIKDIVDKVDIEPKQVIIEAKLVEVYKTDALDIGVNWNLANSQKSGDAIITVGGAETGTPGSPSRTGLLPSEVAQHYKNTGNYDGLTGQPTSMGLGGTGVNYALTAKGGGITIGAVMDNMMTNITLAALKQKGRTKTLSEPSIIAINNREARILIGDKVPYLITTLAPNGASTQSTAFIDIGIRLIVKPVITSDNRIILDVHPEVSTLRSIRPEGPQLATREADTTVMIKDGQTIVIGGLITDSDIKTAEKFPILGDIPVLGQLFRHNKVTKENVELLIFLTPKIVE